MSGEILKFEHVTVGYDARDVVRDFSCSIRQGEFVSLIGPNGSGKSTLIHTVTGITKLKAGRIFLDGKDNETLSAKERAQIAAVVPQHFIGRFCLQGERNCSHGKTSFSEKNAV